MTRRTDERSPVLTVDVGCDCRQDTLDGRTMPSADASIDSNAYKKLMQFYALYVYIFYFFYRAIISVLMCALDSRVKLIDRVQEI